MDFCLAKRGQQRPFSKKKWPYPETQIFYESPHRVKATLENMLAVYGDRSVVLVRELTKIYEEYTRGSISELVAFLEENPLKGECLLIVRRSQGRRARPRRGRLDSRDRHLGPRGHEEKSSN